MTIETREALDRLARSVVAALASAGLPSNLDEAASARVEPGWDQDDDRWRFVEVRWRREAAIVVPIGQSLLDGVRHSPQLSFDYAVGVAMAEAMNAILVACGFDVVRGDDDSPADLRVRGLGHLATFEMVVGVSRDDHPGDDRGADG